MSQNNCKIFHVRVEQTKLSRKVFLLLQFSQYNLGKTLISI